MAFFMRLLHISHLVTIGVAVPNGWFALEHFGEQVCDRGHFCLGGEKHPCPSGRHGGRVQGLTSGDQCTPCRAGYFCPSASVSETVCGGAQFFCPPRSGRPTHVSPGYYTVGAGAQRAHAQILCEPARRTSFTCLQCMREILIARFGSAMTGTLVYEGSAVPLPRWSASCSTRLSSCRPMLALPGRILLPVGIGDGNRVWRGAVLLPSGEWAPANCALRVLYNARAQCYGRISVGRGQMPTRVVLQRRRLPTSLPAWLLWESA